MKRVRTLLLPAALMVLVVGFSGCTNFDYATVDVLPHSVEQYGKITLIFKFRSFELTPVTVNGMLSWVALPTGEWGPGPVQPEPVTVPPFQEVEVLRYSSEGFYGLTQMIGVWEIRAEFSTSEGKFEATANWVVVP